MSIAGSCPIAMCCDVEGASCAGGDVFGSVEHAAASTATLTAAHRAVAVRRVSIAIGVIDVFSLSRGAHEIERRQRDHFGRIDEILDTAIFVGLMRQLQLARSV